MEIAALCVRQDSVYKQLGLECYDIERDARSFKGGNPVIAHPPCRAWGRYHHRAKPRPGEKDLALFCLEKVRENGGVLEHPHSSSLWPVAGVLEPGYIDQYGGTTLIIDQIDFGHKAIKRTKLYFVRCWPSWFPPASQKIPRDLERLSKPEREHTPQQLALWLLSIVSKVNKLESRETISAGGASIVHGTRAGGD